MEDNKSCFGIIVGFLLFAIIGNLLFKAIESLGNSIGIMIMTVLGIVFIGFIIMCIRGMKKEKGED
jgi:hypothetical protein